MDEKSKKLKEIKIAAAVLLGIVGGSTLVGLAVSSMAAHEDTTPQQPGTSQISQDPNIQKNIQRGIGDGLRAVRAPAPSKPGHFTLASDNCDWIQTTCGATMGVKTGPQSGERAITVAFHQAGNYAARGPYHTGPQTPHGPFRTDLQAPRDPLNIHPQAPRDPLNIQRGIVDGPNYKQLNKLMNPPLKQV